jgi:translation initiation factor 2B subunit (eIF-2B alpha/beta/delta family)
LKTPDEGGHGEKAIHLDWEHQAWGWYNPSEIEDSERFGGVPRLKNSLRRVWVEGDMNQGASEAFAACLEQLKSDHRSGSHELTSTAVKAFRDVMAQMQEEIDTKWWETARMVAWHLSKSGRESMGTATLNAFLALMPAMEEIVHQNLAREVKWERLLAVLDQHLSKRKNMPARIKASFAEYLQSSLSSRIGCNGDKDSLVILTLSASSTIRESILDAFACVPIPHLDVRVLESRPLCEGVDMASSIVSDFETKFPSSSGRDLKLTVYTDASVAIASQGVDFLLLGADRISAEGSVCNKVGSHPAVLTVKQVSSASVLVLSELEKVDAPGAGDVYDYEDNGPGEVVSFWKADGVQTHKIIEEMLQSTHQDVNYAVEVKNVYFEWIPPWCTDAFICEQGVLGTADIKEKAYQVELGTGRYFHTLW